MRRAASVLVLVLAAAAFNPVPARADDGFPFGLEMTLDVARQPGSKRIPTLEIGDAGEVILELWCKGGKGPVFGCRQYRDLRRGADGGAFLSAGAGVGR
jgi:hypothetical protein